MFSFIRNRLRQYPAFVNCTTIDWFSEWPKDALLEVAEKYLEDVNLGPNSDEVSCVCVCVCVCVCIDVSGMRLCVCVGMRLVTMYSTCTFDLICEDQVLEIIVHVHVCTCMCYLACFY